MRSKSGLLRFIHYLETKRLRVKNVEDKTVREVKIKINSSELNAMRFIRMKQA